MLQVQQFILRRLIAEMVDIDIAVAIAIIYNFNTHYMLTYSSVLFFFKH